MFLISLLLEQQYWRGSLYALLLSICEFLLKSKFTWLLSLTQGCQGNAPSVIYLFFLNNPSNDDFWFSTCYLTICTTEAADLHQYACPLIFWLNDNLIWFRVCQVSDLFRSKISENWKCVSVIIQYGSNQARSTYFRKPSHRTI